MTPKVPNRVRPSRPRRLCWRAISVIFHKPEIMALALALFLAAPTALAAETNSSRHLQPENLLPSLKALSKANQNALTEVRAKRLEILTQAAQEPLFIPTTRVIFRSDELKEKEEAYAKALTELITLRAGRSDKHPDVQEKVAEVSRIKAQVEREKSKEGKSIKLPRNPEFDRLQGEMDALNVQILKLESTRFELDKKIRILEGSTDKNQPPTAPKPKEKALDLALLIEADRLEIKLKEGILKDLENKKLNLEKQAEIQKSDELLRSRTLLQQLAADYAERLNAHRSDLKMHTEMLEAKIETPPTEILAPPGSPLPILPAPKALLSREIRGDVRNMIGRDNYSTALVAVRMLLLDASNKAERAYANLLLARALGIQAIEYRHPPAHNEARLALRDALALDPDLASEPGIPTLRAKLNIFDSTNEKRLAALNQALNETHKNPANASKHFYLALLRHFLAAQSDTTASDSMRQTLRQAAATAIDKALQIDPRNFEYWAWKITILYDADRHDDARAAAELMMKTANLSPNLIPPGVSSPYVISSAFLKGEEKKNYLRKQAQAHPSDTLLQLAAAQSHRDESPTQYRLALRTLLLKFDTGRIETPTWGSRAEVSALYYLAAAHAKANEIQKALDAYDRLIALSPYFAETRYNRGLLYQAQASKTPNKEQKTQLLKKAITEFQTQLSTHWHGKTEAAQKALTTALQELEVWER